MSGVKGTLIKRVSIPEYYKRFIDSKIDLNNEPKICCPFHDENTPSWTYSADKGLWRCWGACKTGGDVIKLHQVHYHLRTYEEALESLAKIYGIDINAKPDFKFKQERVDEERVAMEVAYNRALALVKTPEQFIELDFLMSMYKPVSERRVDLEVFLGSLGND